MADISKINGVPIANIEKLDAVLAANIAKVNGLVFSIAPAFTGLLDTYTGAAAGYSTRKLKTGVTVAARIRRSGDNIEADVEFDTNNEISLTSPISNASSGTYTDLADFVDHATTPRDAFVKEWKDQSGNGNDATQSTTSKQPQIYDATTGIITANGKPAVDADAVDYSGFPISLGLSQPFTNFVVGENTDALGAAVWYGFSPQMNAILNANVYAGNSLSTTVDLRGTDHMMWAVFNGTSSKLKAISPATNQEVSGNAGTDTNFNYLLRRYDFDQGNALRANEVIFWDSEQSSTNLSGIESSLNSDYLIYQPTDAPTSGLLATYTGAAAAYSVRQLSDKAVIALRIRRDSDDEEINIGFDSNGDLDTTAISDFCSTANGYVTRWWDQSTNGNHADQPVGGTGSNVNQPQIYNGTAVIEENGKPALSATALQRFDVGNTPTFTDFTFTIVSKKSGTDTGIIAYDNGSGYLFPARSTGSPYMQAFVSPGADTLFSTTLGNTSAVGSLENSQILSYGYRSGTSADAGMNGEVNTTATVGTDAFTLRTLLDYGGFASFSFAGTVQEMIFWSSSKNSNRTGIETDINTYFSIYT